MNHVLFGIMMLVLFTTGIIATLYAIYHGGMHANAIMVAGIILSIASGLALVIH